jgi:hypothetical protein
MTSLILAGNPSGDRPAHLLPAINDKNLAAGAETRPSQFDHHCCRRHRFRLAIPLLIAKAGSVTSYQARPEARALFSSFLKVETSSTEAGLLRSSLFS